MNKALLNQSLNGSLIDNYVLTHYSEYVKNHPVRIETTYNHPITYGIAVKDNSTKMVKCFRTYVRNHPQEVFEIIAKNLQPLIVSLFALKDLKMLQTLAIFLFHGFCHVFVYFIFFPSLFIPADFS